jgi:Spy/CpxP family protein refolding chaperone
MNSDKFYKIVIIFLMVLNVGTLGFLWLNGKQREGRFPPSPREADRMMTDRMKFDEKQLDQFEDLKHEHHEQMIQLHEQAKELHVALFGLLKEKVIDTVKRNNLIQLLQQNSRQKEIVTFDHFRKLRAILRPDQTQYFDGFMEEFSRRIMSPRPSGRERF